MSRASTTEWKSKQELRSAADAAERMIGIMQMLAVRGQTIPGLLLGQRPMAVWAHYPAKDAHDPRTAYRYYYHAHPQRDAREHGHFHLFRYEPRQTLPSHLLAVGIDAHGMPYKLFTTNRWVTDEHPIPGARILRHLRSFHLDTPTRLRSVHDWLSNLLQVFAPQIRQLLQRRDERLRTGGPRLLDDRRSMILSSRNVSIQRQVRSIERLLTTKPAGEHR